MPFDLRVMKPAADWDEPDLVRSSAEHDRRHVAAAQREDPRVDVSDWKVEEWSPVVLPVDPHSP